MSKCPKCKKRVEFSKLFWHPAEIELKCTKCGSFLKINSSRRVVSIVIFLIIAAAIFHPGYGLRSITDSLILLISPLVAALLLVIFMQKFEIVEKDFIIRNNDTGIEQTIIKEDWDDIVKNGKANNFTIKKG